jgi:hypothetical protein
VLNIVVDSVQSGQVLLDAAQSASNAAQNASNTSLEVQANIAAEAAAKQNQITAAYLSVMSLASNENIGATAQASSDIEAARNSADQLYHDGIRDLGQSVQVAIDLLDDQSSEGSDQ